MAGDPNGDGSARVTRTGIAVVHEGERISAAPGADAELVRAGDEGLAEVRYVFPVEIEVRGGVEPVDAHAIADLALVRLAQGLRSI
jgi:hypothetical protein